MTSDITDTEYEPKIGYVIEVYRNPYAPNDDGSIKVEVNGKVLSCFVYDWEKEFVKGETTSIKFEINDISIKKSIIDAKSIIHHKNLGKWGYTINGKVISIIQSQKDKNDNLVIIDCGINVIAFNINKKHQISNGDYMEIEGRLDAFKLG